MKTIKQITGCVLIVAGCAFGASGCSDADCSVGERKCDGNTFMVCNERGAWQSIICEKTIPVCDEQKGCVAVSQTCGDGIMQGMEACDKNSMPSTTCNDIFEGLVGTLTCTDQCTLDTSSCHVPDCLNGDVKCADNVLHTCQNGDWLQQPCGDKICDVEKKLCAEKNCTQEARRCTDEQLEICMDNRWLAVMDCRIPGFQCDEIRGMCVQDTCEEGEQTCETEDGKSYVSECVHNAWQRTECTSDTVCTKNIDTNQFSCAVKMCTEGTSCVGDVLMTCKYNIITGSRDCASEGLQCTDGACQ